MRICQECKLEISEDQLCRDMFGGWHHPQCYVDAYPPHPSGREDPERQRAFRLISKSNAE